MFKTLRKDLRLKLVETEKEIKLYLGKKNLENFNLESSQLANSEYENLLKNIFLIRFKYKKTSKKSIKKIRFKRKNS